LWIVAQRAVRAPQIGPSIVSLVDRHVIGLLLTGQRYIACLMRADIDAREICAPGISHPQHIPILVGTHPARSLRPGQRIVEVGLIIGLVKLALFRGERSISSLMGESLISCALPVAPSPLPMRSRVIPAHQPLPLRSPAAPKGSPVPFGVL